MLRKTGVPKDATRNTEAKAAESSEDDDDSYADSESVGGQGPGLSRAQQIALAQCPIRTKCRKKEKGKPGRRGALRRGPTVTDHALHGEADNRSRRRFSLVSVAEQGRVEMKAMLAAVEEVKGTIGKAGVGSADVAAFQIVDRMRKKSPEEETPHLHRSYVAEQKRRARRASLDSMMEATGMSKRAENDLNQMVEKGKYHSGAVDAAWQGHRSRQDPDAIHLDTEEVFQEMQRDASENVGSAAGGLLEKSLIHAPCLEGLMHNNQGGRAVRRKPAEHEAVYDFADKRISMPRYLADEKAGQLVRVRPRMNAEGTRGVVVMETRVPHRLAASEESRLDAICDISMLEQHAQELQHEREMPSSLRSHAHLHSARFPRSTEVWNQLRSKQSSSAREAEQHQDAEARAQRVARSPQRKETNNSVAGGASARTLTESGISESRLGSKALSTIDSDTKALSTIDLDSRAGSKEAAGNRDGRRMAMDLSSAADGDVPWDARPPPTGPEAERFFERIAFVNQLKASQKSFVARERRMHARIAEPEQHTWTLEAVGPLGFALTFTAPADAADAADDPGDLEDDAEDDAFWGDFFRPAPGTGREVRCFGGCIC